MRIVLSLFFSLLSFLCISQTFNILTPAQYLRNTINTSEVFNADVFILEQEATSALIKNDIDSIDIPIFLYPFGELTFKLEKKELFVDSAIVKTFASGIKSANNVKAYRGEIKDYPDSRVSLVISKEEVIGFFEFDGDRWTIGKPVEKTTPGLHLIYPSTSLVEEKDTFKCFTPTGLPVAHIGKNTKTKAKKCVSVYLEVDYDIYQGKGGLDQTIIFILGLFNEVSALYQKDNISLKISQIKVWDRPSGYSSKDSYTILREFQSRIAQNLPGDLGQLLSYKASGGIAASLSGLCASNVSRKLSFSSIRSSYKIVPQYSWSVMVIAHEFGHLLGSPHTHACSWNGNNTAIDGCAGYTEGSCLPPANPSSGGTIMSYCHLTTIGINMHNGFGEQPGNLIRSRINNSSCLQNCDPAKPEEPGKDSSFTFSVEVKFDLFANEFGILVTEDNKVLKKVKTGSFKYKTLGEKREFKFKGEGKKKYKITIEDSNSDGLCCDFGNGEIKITVKDSSFLVPEFSDSFVYEFSEDKDIDKHNNCEVEITKGNVISFGGSQDRGAHTVENGELVISDNAWKAIRGKFKVQKDTRLQFEFKSTKKGEIHGIGFDENTTISNSLTFQLYGTQPWGKTNYFDYNAIDDWKYYDIPVGQLIPQKEYSYLFFVADMDSAPRKNNSQFRNIKICN